MSQAARKPEISNMQNDTQKSETPAALDSMRLLGQSEIWFSYDPQDGFEFHTRAEDAQARADKCLDYYKDDAPSDGWSEEVTGVCWGKVAQKVEELWRKQRPPANDLDESGYDKDGTRWGEWDELVDYGLCPNEKGQP